MNEMLYERTVNEPKVHPLVRRSFFFVPSVGMRLAPELLVLELMREVFFGSACGERKARDLNPGETGSYSNNERAVLYSLRGRRKETKQSKVQQYFAPAYPQLAESGWFRKNSDRVVHSLLLAGPIAQDLWNRGPDSADGKNRQKEITDTVWHALVGDSFRPERTLEGKDILAATLGSENLEIDIEEAVKRFRQKTDFSDSVMRVDRDELASRITQDFVAICEIEPKLPRLQWIQLLMTFLRFALPMWLLAHMQMTKLLHEWLLAAMDGGTIAGERAIFRELAERNRGLLHPTLTPTRELFEHIEQYIKCRVETSILANLLEKENPESVMEKRLDLSSGRSDVLSIGQLLILARNSTDVIRSRNYYRQVSQGMSVRTFLTREGEQFPAWRNPLMHGQGKNIDEFFRVLYQAALGDEGGGYLLTPEGRGTTRGFRVFPGQLLLKTVTFLAACNKRSGHHSGGIGRLVLQDVEDHFGQYGIDFSTAADARPLLMNELQAMGLLSGSPDAGSSVAVACPYTN